MSNSSIFRLPLIFFCFCSVFLCLLYRLFSLQILHHEFYKNLAQRQYTLKVTLLPERGLIYDSHNVPLCGNKEGLSAFIEPKKLLDRNNIEILLERNFPTAYKRYLNDPHASFLYIKRRLTDAELETLTSTNSTDIHFLKESERTYFSPLTTTITGITSHENEGLFGLEWLYNKQLQGTPTEYLLEKDAQSSTFSVAKQNIIEGVEPITLHTTIDAQLQEISQEELSKAAAACSAQEGALIIMDPETGAILAAASYPTFDQSVSTELDLRATKNNCFTQCYEFGSVFKSFTALAALEDKVVTPDEVINCHNTKEAYIKNRKITTTIPLGHATFDEIIRYSNNIGIAIVAFRLQERLYDYLKLFGFGSNASAIFPGQQKGFINPPQSWSAHSIISLSYGYEVSATLTQLVRAFSLFGNGGHLIEPHLVKKDSHTETQQIISTETINQMRDILQRTTQKGTAIRAHIPGYTILSKTGTANLIVNGTYDRSKNIYCYLGILEKGNYKRAIGCYLKDTSHKNSFASTVTAPLGKAVMEKMVIHEHQISSSL